MLARLMIDHVSADPLGLRARIATRTWTGSWLRDAGDLTRDEMRRTFNCGVGGVVITSPDAVDDIISVLEKHGEDVRVIGEIVGK